MPEDPTLKIRRHLRNGVVVDSGLLVVYFVGLYQDATGLPLWQTLKQTKGSFYRDDYEFLLGFLQKFRKQVVTPHILTEVSNMLGHLNEPARETCFGLLRAHTAVLEERFVEAAEITSEEAFLRLGLTDVGILRVASAAPYLVLTIDAPLVGQLNKIGVDALLFRDIRHAV